jgi:5-oxoprolinase (ATP-hydrolysing) subunit A
LEDTVPLQLAIDINADIGESFGAYRIGSDVELLKIVSSANVACGFHAGDPEVMAQTCEAAAAGGVSVGAHPGYPDLQGFGRRAMNLSASEIEAVVAYQIGALQAIAKRAGTRVAHVKAHGALYYVAERDRDVAAAIARSVRSVDSALILVAAAGSAMEGAAGGVGLRFVGEGFPDRAYDDDGRLLSRKVPGSIVHDPALAAKNARRMAIEGTVETIGGRTIKADIRTLCVHGDAPGAVSIASAVRATLESEGVKIVSLPVLFQ